MTLSTLLQHEDNWSTELGCVSIQSGAVTLRGHDLLNALEDLSWMDMLMFGITGRRFSSEQLELFQGLWKISASYPEPRIWNNRVAALGGSARSTPGLTLGAAVAVTDAAIYGQQPMIGAFDFLQRAGHTCNEDPTTLADFIRAELKATRGVPGYGRPLRKVDERLAPAERLARRLGLWGGQHCTLAFMVEDFLKPYRLGMNVAALAAALYADQGLTVAEYQHATLLAFSAGLINCALDARLHPEGTLFPLRCSRLHYSGPKSRSW